MLKKPKNHHTQNFDQYTKKKTKSFIPFAFSAPFSHCLKALLVQVLLVHLIPENISTSP